jgi:hypothetical protein
MALAPKFADPKTVLVGFSATSSAFPEVAAAEALLVFCI